MMTPPGLIERRDGAPSDYIDFKTRSCWRQFSDTERKYVCRALICPEDDGGFSAIALRLPGVVSQGETIGEAVENIREAFSVAIQVYLDAGDAIPWCVVEVERTKGCVERRILVDVD